MPTPLMLPTVLSSLLLLTPLPSWAAPQPAPISVSPQKSVMEESYKSGRLPAPLPIPSGKPDAAIKTLVRQIAAKDKSSTAAMLTAMQLAGYTIIDRAGRKVITPSDGNGQGMALEDWEMATTAKMYGEGRRKSLAELADTLRLAMPQLAEVDLPALLIEGIKTNYLSEERPFLRAWARLIVELGLRAPEPYDLFLNPRPDRVMLDPIQTELILYRFVGDLYALSKRAKTQPVQSGMVPIPDSPSLAGGGAPFVSSSLASHHARPMLVADSGGGGASHGPCHMDDTALTIVDGVATIFGTGWGQLLSHLEKQGGKLGEAAGNLDSFYNTMNVILAYAKFLQTYASLEVTLSAEEGALVRTKNALPGAQKKLQARVVLNIGNWEMLNCFRLAILPFTKGLDISTMADGPVKGAGVMWHLDEGGDRDMYSNRTGLTGKEGFVGYIGDTPGRPRIQDAGTKAGSGGTGVQVGNAAYTFANDDGLAANTLEGKPQRNAKLGKLVEVHKQARVRVTVAVKANEVIPDLVDVTGITIPILASPESPPMVLLQMPVEILYRVAWASSDELVVPVIDWEECAGGWTGTVTYAETTNITEEDRVIVPNGVTNHKNTVRNSYTGTININNGTATATATMSSTSRRDESSIRYGKCHSYDKVKPLLGDVSSVAHIEGSGTKTTAAESKDDHGLPPLALPEIEATSGFSEHRSLPCGAKSPEQVPKPPTKVKIDGRSVRLEGAQPDADDPNRMHGSKTYNIGGTSMTVITWDLARCTSMP